MNEKKEILRESLYFWWLRPENGLAIASYCIYGTSLKPAPNEVAADFACGDGLNTFFKCGGRFDHKFDLFRGGADIKKMSEIVNNKIDVFDCIEDKYSPVVRKKPDVKYSFGTDHKLSLLKKAKKLGFYSNLLHENLEKESVIENHSLDFAYCNSLYWVPDPSNAIRNISRKVKKNGSIVFDVFTKEKYKLDFCNLYPEVDQYWQKIMNRGRMENNPGLKSESEWEKIFLENNLLVQAKHEILPNGIAKFWNFGLRPIFPVLMRMIKYISEENILEVKNEWVEIWTELLFPLLTNPECFSDSDTKYRIQYVLDKK